MTKWATTIDRMPVQGEVYKGNHPGRIYFPSGLHFEVDPATLFDTEAEAIRYCMQSCHQIIEEQKQKKFDLERRLMEIPLCHTK